MILPGKSTRDDRERQQVQFGNVAICERLFHFSLGIRPSHSGADQAQPEAGQDFTDLDRA